MKMTVGSEDKKVEIKCGTSKEKVPHLIFLRIISSIQTHYYLTKLLIIPN